MDTIPPYFTPLMLKATSIWDSISDWYAYNGIQAPAITYPSANLEQIQKGNWNVEQALAESWNSYINSNKQFFEEQFQRNQYTTPSITPDSLQKFFENNWKSIAIVAGLGVVGLMVATKVVVR